MPVFFDLHVLHQVDLNIYINHLQVVRFPLDRFCVLIRSGFISIIDDFVLLILFIQIFNTNWWYFFRVLKLWSIHRFKQQFCLLFLKASTKAVWVCLYFVVALQISTLCFSSNFVISLLNSGPLSHWNTFGYLSTPPFL